MGIKLPVEPTMRSSRLSRIVFSLFALQMCTAFVQQKARATFSRKPEICPIQGKTTLSVLPGALNPIATNALWVAESDQGLSQTQTVLIFIAGLIPFAVATVEFWRRIAFGESFGTGTDSVVIIGEDDAPESSRGRRVLGKGALITAYILFGISAFVLGIVLFSVLTTDPSTMMDEIASQTTQ